MSDVYIHATIKGAAIPAKRRAAVLVPTASGPVLLSRARAARSARDLFSLFRATTAPKTSAAGRAWRKQAEWALRQSRHAVIGSRPIVPRGTPVEVWILVVQPMAASRRLKRSIRPREWDTRQSSGDFDNIAKPICDAANGVLWHDDCQIVRASVEQVIAAQDEEPRLEILVRGVTTGPEETNFARVLSDAKAAAGHPATNEGTEEWRNSHPSLPIHLGTARDR